MKGKIWIWVLAAALLLLTAGCRVTDMSDEETEPLDYTVVKEEDLPREIAELIRERKEEEFQMTYQSENELYLMRGYGRQMSGGYSIQVEDLSLGKEAIYFQTVLVGPDQGEEPGREPSYPYIAVKLEYREEPVQFQ